MKIYNLYNYVRLTTPLIKLGIWLKMSHFTIRCKVNSRGTYKYDHQKHLTSQITLENLYLNTVIYIRMVIHLQTFVVYLLNGNLPFIPHYHKIITRLCSSCPGLFAMDF